MAEKITMEGRVAVVTGAGRGLGRAYARELSALGARVVVNDPGVVIDGTGSDTAPAERVVEEIKGSGGEAVPNFDSVAEWDSARKIIQTAIDEYGQIDILVNNAGVIRDHTLEGLSVDDWNTVMSVHLFGTFYCVKAAFARMSENGYGRIVSTTSGAGLFGNVGQAAYAAAKMGIVGLMKVVALEGAERNIKANTISPAAGTRVTKYVLPPEVVELLKPEYVAKVVAYLSSEGCEPSGAVIVSGANYVSRAAMVEGRGLFLSDVESADVQEIAESMKEVMSLDDAVAYGSLVEEVGYLFSHLGLDAEKDLELPTGEF